MTVDEATSKTELWPNNLESVNVFIALLTQWRTGMNGPTGLDYGVIEDVFKLLQLPENRWRDVFSDLRLMEDESLKIIREKAKRNG